MGLARVSLLLRTGLVRMIQSPQDLIYEAVIDAGVLAEDERHWEDVTNRVLDYLRDGGYTFIRTSVLASLT